jgi:hypothetical protein
MKTKTAQPPFVNFLVAREYLGRDGNWNPRFGGPPVKGGFQINVFGRREHYLWLAKFFRKFAERDTSSDGNYHEHFEGLMSLDGTVRLNLILRKDDVGDSSWKGFFPKARKKMTRRAKA